MVCLGEVEGINTRIAEFQKTLAPPSYIPPIDVEVEKLPTIGTGPRQGQVLANPPGPHVSPFPISYFDKHPFVPPVDVNSKAQQYLDSARGKVLNPRQQEVLTRQGMSATFQETRHWILCSRGGWLFRQTFRRRLCSVILGTPYSNLHNILHAVHAITTLSVTSVDEDLLGTVSKDMPLLMRTFVNSIQSIEKLKGTMRVHWTDVEFRPQGADQGRNVEEIGILLAHLKEGLTRVLEVFEFLAVELGLGPAELRRARAVAGMK